MNTKFIMTMAVMLSGMAAFAQSLSEGYYRVQNMGSGRYMYIKDCTGQVSTLGAEMGSMEMWHGADSAMCDPGSVMYLDPQNDGYWDITSQATSVSEIIDRYMSIYDMGTYCYVYYGGQYLYEDGTSEITPDKGYVVAANASEMSGKTKYRQWLTKRIDSSSDNYFGFKPSVNAGGRYYAPFYADFAYTPLCNQKTWYVSKVDKEYGVAVVEQISGSVAKSQPVFVECVSENMSDNKIELLHKGGNSAKGNVLKGLYFDDLSRTNYTEYVKTRKNPAAILFDSSTMRVLGTDENGKLAFVSSSPNIVQSWMIENRKLVWKDCLPHNTCYLQVDSDCPVSLTVMTEDEYEEYKKHTGIDAVAGGTSADASVIYDLNGRRYSACEATQLPHGIYIQGNRRFVK